MTMKEKLPEEAAAALRQFRDANDSDVFIYSGDIAQPGGERFVHYVLSREQRRPRATLFLTTYGGDAHWAFRIMRALQRSYQDLRLLIVGPCKSAGTLMVVGADELAFGPWGELGPIDVQMAKRDEIVLSSGLDTIQGLESLIHQVFGSFESYLLNIMGKSSGAISTRTASEIAGQLVTGIFQPIAGQIDPHRLGEVERAMRIALDYGTRLRRENVTFESLAQLVHAYPSHGFVIDVDEARKLFKNVRELSETEYNLLPLVGELVASPQTEVVTVDLGRLAEDETDEPTREEPDASPPHSEPVELHAGTGELGGGGDRHDGQGPHGAAKDPKHGRRRRVDPQDPDRAAEGGSGPGEPTAH